MHWNAAEFEQYYIKQLGFLTNATLESKHSVFHTIFVHLFLAVRISLATYNL